jgi:hypothetical protein
MLSKYKNNRLTPRAIPRARLLQYRKLPVCFNELVVRWWIAHGAEKLLRVLPRERACKGDTRRVCSATQ